MEKIELQPGFKARITEVHGERGLQWLKALPSLIAELSQNWDFQFISSLPDLSYGFVARVHFQNQEVILKMNPGVEIIAHEVLWLKQFPHLAPKIFKESAQGAFLMEKILPGYMLKDLVKSDQDDEATRTVCRLVHELQKKPVRSADFPHLSIHKQISLLHGHFDKDLVEKAESLYRDLTVKSESDVLLHGDLHHDNILRHNDTWKIIDPHGYMGDPVFEISPFVYNPLDVLPEHPRLKDVLLRRIDLIREETSFDEKRIKAWAFCMMMLSLAWTFEGTSQVPDFEARAARILSSLV